jgi:hypothetical protein
MQLVLQATICDGLAFNPFEFEGNGLGATIRKVSAHRQAGSFGLFAACLCMLPSTAFSTPTAISHP